MSIFTPILFIVQLVWSLSAIYFITDMGCWFFETEAWYTNILAGAFALFVLMMPLGQLIIVGLLFYYLAFVHDWNIILTIFYLFPGVALAFLGTTAEMLGNVFRKRH